MAAESHQAQPPNTLHACHRVPLKTQSSGKLKTDENKFIDLFRQLINDRCQSNVHQPLRTHFVVLLYVCIWDVRTRLFTFYAVNYAMLYTLCRQLAPHQEIGNTRRLL